MSSQWLDGGPGIDDAEEEKERARARGGGGTVLVREIRQPDLDLVPEPWKKNPSAWRQRVPIAVLATIGFGISSYLALFQWGLVETVWDPLFGAGTENVLASNVSKSMHRFMGMPDAALGAFAYLGDAVFGLAGSTRRWQYRPWMVLLFGFDVIPLGIVSAVLVVMQGTVVGAWCFLCLVTAVISLSLIPLAADEVYSTLVYLRRVRKRGGWRQLWDTFLGRPSELAEQVALEMGGR